MNNRTFTLPNGLIIFLILSFSAVVCLPFIASATLVPDDMLVPDDKGVMMFDYHGVQRKVYNPLSVAIGGMEYYLEYKNHGDKESKQYFINTADWLVNNANDRGEYSIWEYNFPWRFYGWVSPPYSSALAQAQGLNVLLAAYDLTKNEKYLIEANNALGSFLVDYENGGVVSNEDGDSLFLHLLAKPGFQKIYVLNGHTWSLLLLWNYYQQTQDPTVKAIFDKGIKWLRENLWKYDTGSWSNYDQMEHLALPEYHTLHITQLANLYEITGEQIFKEYSDRFDRYNRNIPLDIPS
ncbi:MAG TPA: D-glucuronyl C5-epimerase family protein [Nitrososphaeraceae archaeon]|jgi:hypothetical protein|nr:D-glucuronyl C5-epimerase family protein [Nitrososphaeraceae archaeon]